MQLNIVGSENSSSGKMPDLRVTIKVILVQNSFLPTVTFLFKEAKIIFMEVLHLTM